MIDMNVTGNNITKLRRLRCWTQRDLARAVSVSHQAVSKWENGCTLPDIQTLLNLSRLFGVSIEEILIGSANEAA